MCVRMADKEQKEVEELQARRHRILFLFAGYQVEGPGVVVLKVSRVMFHIELRHFSLGDLIRSNYKSIYALDFINIVQNQWWPWQRKEKAVQGPWQAVAYSM